VIIKLKAIGDFIRREWTNLLMRFIPDFNNNGTESSTKLYSILHFLQVINHWAIQLDAFALLGDRLCDLTTKLKTTDKKRPLSW
jgi:hypothetical protein